MPRIFITLSDSLSKVAEINRLRHNYRTKSEYLQAVIRIDSRDGHEHHIAEKWAALTPRERDALDEAILEQVQRAVRNHNQRVDAQRKRERKKPSTQQMRDRRRPRMD